MSETPQDQERPLADEDLETFALGFFPAKHTSPEEFAARVGPAITGFDMGGFRFRDAELDVWVRRLKEILDRPELLRECQEKYLTPEELQRLQEPK